MRKTSTLAFLITSVPALAQDNWLASSASSSGAVWFVEVDSIKDIKEGYPATIVRKAWIKIDHSKEASEAARESKVLFFFKCDEERAKSTVWVMYRANGTVLKDMSREYAPYQTVIPGSVLAGTMKNVCSVKLANPL